MAVRYTLRWLVIRLFVGGCVLLAVQILSQLTFMSMKDANMDCEQKLMFKQRISELITPVAMDKSEAESVREVTTAEHIPDKAIGNLAKSLKQLAVELMETQRSLAYSAQHFTRLNLHVQSINRILKTLQEAEVQNNNSFSPGKVSAKDNPSPKKEVCPEKFMGTNLAYGYPFFRKGFATLNCTDVVPIHKLITLLIDIPQELSRPADDYLQILQGVEKYYPKVSVILRTENAIEESKMASISKLEIDFKNEVYPKDVRQGNVWDKLLEQVRTPYVLVAPQISHFNDDIDLKRLLRVLSDNDGVMIAGGSYRNLQGEWDIGCQQDSFKNWTVTYKGGYYFSFSECVVCDFMPGPWAAKTQALKELKFDASMPYGAFHDLFWRLKRSAGSVAVSCPDVMFNVITRDVKDEEYVSFANKFDIKKWVDTNGRVRWYGCRRGYAHTNSGCSFGRGIGVPPCNLENLADAIKFIMKECEDAGMFCEFQSGTLLGAVKFNKVIPWERDADLTFLTANYTAFKRLQSTFSQHGISMSAEDSSLWCCADGRQAGGIIHAGTYGWSIQMYGQHLMESEILVAQGQRPTKVLFAGQWVSVMRNPGLYARNNYGAGIYLHQEHWMDMGHTTGWSFYSPGSFTKCSHPGHSACLDQYPADGNMQFSDYSP